MLSELLNFYDYLMVFCDIIEYQRVGDQYGKLLRSITKTSDFNTSFLNDDVNSYLVWHNDKEDENHYFPQIKSRIFEASIMRCIMLVYKDKYNIIEDYFEENTDFLYFENETQLNEIIEKILTNYDSYKYLAENAFNKTFNNYTTKNLVDLVHKSLKN
jgi:hypothetical protein